jgi:hypothetical protein
VLTSARIRQRYDLRVIELRRCTFDASEKTAACSGIFTVNMLNYETAHRLTNSGSARYLL